MEIENIWRFGERRSKRRTYSNASFVKTMAKIRRGMNAHRTQLTEFRSYEGQDMHTGEKVVPIKPFPIKVWHLRVNIDGRNGLTLRAIHKNLPKTFAKIWALKILKFVKELIGFTRVELLPFFLMQARRILEEATLIAQANANISCDFWMRMLT